MTRNSTLVCFLAMTACAHRDEAAAPSHESGATLPAVPTEGAPVEAVASFGDQQATGVAVSRTSRVFVSFPRWGDDLLMSVAEVMADGTLKPFPDARWNEWDPKKPDEGRGDRWVCVQSVWVDASDQLWILDPGSPRMEGVLPGAAKLVQIDLTTDAAVRTIPFSPEIAPARSYLNDVRVSASDHMAYVSDSGLGALVVVDLQSGAARRVLEDHPSTKAELVPVTVGGLAWQGPQGNTPVIHVDGLALDTTRQLLYYRALTGRTIYRVPTAALRDPDADLGAGVEKVLEAPPGDGMELGADGRLYLTDLERFAVTALDPLRPTEPTIVARGPLLDWPDSLAMAPDGGVYVTASQIERSPRFRSHAPRSQPYRLFKIRSQPVFGSR